jgi:hypothetical protein
MARIHRGGDIGELLLRVFGAISAPESLHEADDFTPKLQPTFHQR